VRGDSKDAGKDKKAGSDAPSKSTSKEARGEKGNAASKESTKAGREGSSRDAKNESKGAAKEGTRESHREGRAESKVASKEVGKDAGKEATRASTREARRESSSATREAVRESRTKGAAQGDNKVAGTRTRDATGKPASAPNAAKPNAPTTRVVQAPAPKHQAAGLQAIRERLAIAAGQPVPALPTPSSGLNKAAMQNALNQVTSICTKIGSAVCNGVDIKKVASLTATNPAQDIFEAKFDPGSKIPGAASMAVDVPVANSTAAAVANTAAIAPPPPGDVMAESYHQNVWIDNSSTSRVGKSHTSIQYTQELESVNLMSNMNIIFIP
jgi:hypothetical protein